MCSKTKSFYEKACIITIIFIQLDFVAFVSSNADMYAKPPKHSQFKPGQSGNPHGRPRKMSDSAIIDLTYQFFRALVSARDGNATARAKIALIKRILDEK